ncbi:dihydroxyacetone kinase subunit DhaK [Brachybacterium huguangmaarense]
MKKLITSPDSVVADALQGMALAHPRSLRVDLDNRVVLRAEPKAEGRVALVSGGGSGHEPLHAGFVGRGMLDAACAGEVFTSPVPDQMQAAAEAVDRGAGVLFIVKNYTGDVMNFDMAAELADATGDVTVRQVVTNDDVAVEDSTYTAGRRGVAGTLLVEKIAGAAAEEGRSLDEVAEIAERVNASARSMGIALSGVTVPGSEKPSFTLADDEVEIGIGIHGEPGRRREKAATADVIAERLLEPILAELPGEGPVLLLVNGMGATPLLELYVMAKEASRVLEDRGVEVSRHLVGNYVTSLDMAGCSLTLLRLDDELTRLWDAPVSTPALRWDDADEKE